ncbi:DNA-deoxyinosine glycosylase [Arenicella sp. 4NH20-0111]|uniref:DNA-deoxyinosine glycosylase n=1 Tax=Arenicella sp. 4NH20-0111 TaxID=3127648 RepID=UPI0031076291
MTAFAPLLGRTPKTLILGSMPGQRSLDRQQYYAHPQNAFWSIMQELYMVNSELCYSDRVKALVDQSVCVWDVLYDCERPGSLDSKIVSATAQANDFSKFFADNPSISIVGFNGRAARTLFSRFCAPVYEEFPAINWVDLPSTSPAYAAMKPETKKQVWKCRLHIER